MFEEQTIVLRELCNGVMFISAVVTVMVFTRYIFNRARVDRHWRTDIAVQGAAALNILMIGHALRAFTGWMQFVWLDLGIDPTYWTNALEPFIAATALIVIGKMLIVFAFSPTRSRWHLTIAAATLSLAIPTALLLLVFAYQH